MALPDTVKLVLGTPLVFSHTSEYVPTQGQPSGTDADIDLDSVLAGEAQESVKLDIGSANLDVLYSLKAYIEFFSSPTAGGSVDFYLGFSNDTDAGDDNPGGLSGTDGVYQGYGADTASGTEALKQLEYMGSLTVTNDTVLQVAKLKPFQPTGRYCMLVVVNNTSVSLADTDAIETSVVATPIQHQIQD